MKAYSKPLLAKSNQSYENVQLESGDCPGNYPTLCSAYADNGSKCINKVFTNSDDCQFLKITSFGYECIYPWPK